MCQTRITQSITVTHNELLLLMFYCCADPHSGTQSHRICETWTLTREQFKCRLKNWLFECAYSRKCVWQM